MEKERDNSHPPEPMKRKHSTQIISLIVGFLLVILGLSGILFSGFAGLHLSYLYSTIIAISGGILIYNGGFKNNTKNAYICCLGFTILFGLHALAGWVLGQPGIPSVGHSAPDPALLRIIPNIHELGRNDHILNTILALVLMGGAIDWRRRHRFTKEIRRDQKQRRAQQKFNRPIRH